MASSDTTIKEKVSFPICVRHFTVISKEKTELDFPIFLYPSKYRSEAEIVKDISDRGDEIISRIATINVKEEDKCDALFHDMQNVLCIYIPITSWGAIGKADKVTFHLDKVELSNAIAENYFASHVYFPESSEDELSSEDEGLSSSDDLFYQHEGRSL